MRRLRKMNDAPTTRYTPEMLPDEQTENKVRNSEGPRVQHLLRNNPKSIPQMLHPTPCAHPTLCWALKGDQLQGSKSCYKETEGQEYKCSHTLKERIKREETSSHLRHGLETSKGSPFSSEFFFERKEES